MRVVCDIEANSLNNPSKIWCIVLKDIDTGIVYIFRDTYDKFLELAKSINHWIGHNFLEYDYPVLKRLLGLDIPDIWDHCTDTLLISRLVDYSRKGHSIRAYGEQFGIPKHDFNDWTKWSQQMEDYCVRDVDICERVYLLYKRVIDNPDWKRAIQCEHRFQLVINDLHSNGFGFNRGRANTLLETVTRELAVLDKDILEAFPPKLKLVREVHPKVTKHGTLSRTDFRFVADGDLSVYNGGPFSRCVWQEFNPSSHKQIIEVLHSAGWVPTDKTTTHIGLERELSQAKRSRQPVDFKPFYDKLDHLKKYGWKVNETNLATLPDSAPSPARSLAKRILLESRRRTLTEWLGLVQDDDRIHGKFLGIGTWTHRMATQQPNMQNIPNELDTNGTVKLLGKEMRSLWRAPRNRLLVGVDAEGIQLRLFAHYIDDEEFTDALVRGTKAAKTDPHSLNQRILGSVCKSRQVAKRFIYAQLLGAGLGKLAQILECDEQQAQEALDRLMVRYTGWARLKAEVFPQDSRRGYITGLDGRLVAIPGDTPGERRHLAMSGYLQNGESVVMKYACLHWYKEIENDPSLRRLLFRKGSSVVSKGLEGPISSGKIKLVNFVHDEWQTETPNNMEVAIRTAELQSGALRAVGEDLKLKCPLAGSYWNDDHQDYTIGTNWYQTH